MILLEDVTGYTVGREKFLRAEHGGWAYRKALAKSVESGKPIRALGTQSERDAATRYWKRVES